jgi:hypothetical protein
LLAELPLDGRAVGLGGAASELFNKECIHGSGTPEFYLSIRPHGITARQCRNETQAPASDARIRSNSVTSVFYQGQNQGEGAALRLG